MPVLEAFEQELQRLLASYDRLVISSRVRDTIFVNFYNLPKGEYCGAERENNRALYLVRVMGEKVKVEMSVCVFGDRYNMRAKTAAPGKVAVYLANHIKGIIEGVKPHYTHTIVK